LARRSSPTRPHWSARGAGSPVAGGGVPVSFYRTRQGSSRSAAPRGPACPARCSRVDPRFGWAGPSKPSRRPRHASPGGPPSTRRDPDGSQARRDRPASFMASLRPVTALSAGKPSLGAPGHLATKEGFAARDSPFLPVHRQEPPFKGSFGRKSRAAGVPHGEKLAARIFRAVSTTCPEPGPWGGKTARVPDGASRGRKGLQTLA